MQGTEHPTYRPLYGQVAEIERPTETGSSAAVAGFPRADDAFPYVAAKRAIDVVGASALLLLTAPILIAAALAILVTTGRPVLYRQVRAGRDGNPFSCWKLRTMVRQAEAVLAADADLTTSYLVNFKIDGDPRITRVGRILRKTSVDELPQLWNVLRGDMSLVGPRPVTLAEFDTKYGPLGQVVFSVRPGLTGLWQISGRSQIGYAERIELDLEYIRTRSIARDVWIIIKTPFAVIRGGT